MQNALNNTANSQSQSQPKVALVTGSAKRVGKVIVEHLHQHGYQVIIHCNHSVAMAEALANRLNQQRHNSAKVLSADLLDENALARLAKNAITAFGRLDLLVNNASSFYATDDSSFDPSAWHDLTGTNLKAPYHLSCLLSPHLSQSEGSIVNLVDIHADRPLKQHTVYCMAKAGLKMMIKSLACEFAPRIRVNGISPGAILWPEQSLNEQQKDSIVSQIALKRLGSPSDIAATVLFLAQSPYITGQIITVDGGRSLLGANIA